MLLLTTAFAQGPAPIIGPATDKPREGERAPPNCWYTPGGNAAHNGTTSNAAHLRRPVVAWRLKIDGELVGEPLVWDDYFAIGVRVDKKKRAMQVRRLADGSLVGERKLNSTSDPVLTIWGNEVIWRVGQTLELVRFNDKIVKFAKRMPKAKKVGQPVRLGTSVYAVVDGHLTRMRATDFRSEWRSENNRFNGSPAIMGNRVYALCQAKDDKYQVAELDRSSGAQIAVSNPVSLSAAPSDQTSVIVGGTMLFVMFDNGVVLSDYLSQDGTPLNAMQLKLPIQAGAEPEPVSMPVLPGIDSRMLIRTLPTADERPLCLFPAKGKGGMRLDACELHRPLADVPPTISGGIVYFGACAVDLSDLKVLWRLFRDGDQSLPPSRAIPVGQTLLLATSTELIALHQDAPPDAVADELQSTWIDQKRSMLTDLTDRAVRALDLDLAVELLAQSRQMNADESWATKRDKDITKKRRNKRLRAKASEAAAVRAERATLADDLLGNVHKQVAGWAETRPALDVRQGLRYVLGKQPGHAKATAMVRAMLPKGITPTKPFAPVDWLDFIDATSHTEVSFLEASIEDFSNDKLDSLTLQTKQQLLEWRTRWRPDIKALQSERLLLFSPITQPGSLAKALAAGELVCDALEAMFAEMPVTRNDPRPMMVFIYPDRDEYLSESKKLGVNSVSWTAGYYSNMLNETVAKSRMFVPSDDSGFVKVLPTLAHELTHQWLMDRCPAFTPDRVAAMVGPKSFWIVEGFASLVGQFEFDLARRTSRLGSNDSSRIDMVASAKPGQLIPWAKLAAMKRLDFNRFAANQKQKIRIASSVHLGQGFTTTQLSMFYAQSAMLARYLYEGEEGRYRRKLLDFVASYYTGKMDELDFEQAFGVSAKDLGPKIEAHAKQLLH